MFWQYLLLMSFFVLIPLYCTLTDGQAQAAVESGRLSKPRMYATTMTLLWLPTLLLGTYGWLGGISAVDLGLDWQGHLSQWLGLTGLFALLIAAAVVLKGLRGNREHHGQIHEAFAPMRWMMPENKQQLRWFTLGVSVTAGVCEELLYRGFLLHELESWFGGSALALAAALLLSSLLFGFGHGYQGWQGILRTGATGVVLGLVYLVTDSLWVAIGLHVLVDVYAGCQAYIVFSRPTSAREDRQRAGHDSGHVTS